MDFDTVIVVIIGTVVGGIILWILLFPVRQFITQRSEKKKEQLEKLRIHFEDINREVINHISEMARSLTIRNNRLVFGSYAPVYQSYDFEKQMTYECFELHFPQLAQGWKQLKERALKQDAWHKELEKERALFEEWAIRLKRELDKEFEDNIKKASNSYHESYEGEKTEFDHSYDHLTEDFKDFAVRLANKIDNISKFGIGSEFKKIKKCPICQKF